MEAPGFSIIMDHANFTFSGILQLTRDAGSERAKTSDRWELGSFGTMVKTQAKQTGRVKSCLKAFCRPQ